MVVLVPAPSVSATSGHASGSVVAWISALVFSGSIFLVEALRVHLLLPFFFFVILNKVNNVCNHLGSRLLALVLLDPIVLVPQANQVHECELDPTAFEYLFVQASLELVEHIVKELPVLCNLLLSPELLHLLSHHRDELDHGLVVLVCARIEQLVDADRHDVAVQHPLLEQFSYKFDVSGHPPPESLHHRLALHLDLLLLFLILFFVHFYVNFLEFFVQFHLVDIFLELVLTSYEDILSEFAADVGLPRFSLDSWRVADVTAHVCVRLAEYWLVQCFFKDEINAGDHFLITAQIDLQGLFHQFGEFLGRQLVQDGPDSPLYFLNFGAFFLLLDTVCVFGSFQTRQLFAPEVEVLLLVVLVISAIPPLVSVVVPTSVSASQLPSVSMGTVGGEEARTEHVLVVAMEMVRLVTALVTSWPVPSFTTSDDLRGNFDIDSLWFLHGEGVCAHLHQKVPRVDLRGGFWGDDFGGFIVIGNFSFL